MRIISKFNSIFTAYLAWVLILLANIIWYIYTKDFYKHFGVNQTHFLIMLVTAFFIPHAIGSVLAWYTEKRKNWAKWLFIIFCLLFALDSFFSIIEITEIYKHADDYNPYKKLLSIIVWCLLAGMAWVKSSNKPFKPTPKSGAV